MTGIFVSISFLIGLAVGSFLNVIILRGIKKQSFGGRSKCLSCRKVLSWYELVPVVSYVIQKGRCRSCDAVLLLQYPLVEFGTGVAYAVAASQIAPVGLMDLVVLTGTLIAIAAVVVIVVSDLRWQIVPNGAVLTLLIIGIAAVFLRLSQTKSSTFVLDLVWDISAAVALSLFLGALWFFSRGTWMGFGDVKLIFATSLIVGFPASIAALLFSFWLGGIFGIILLAVRVQTLQGRMPFGPFIIIGTVLAYFFHEALLKFFIVI